MTLITGRPVADRGETHDDIAVGFDNASDLDVATNPVAIAQSWIAVLEAAFRANAPAEVTKFFHVYGWWRDQLMFGWDLRTLHGTDAIQDHLAETMSTAEAGHFALSPDHPPKRVDGPVGRVWIGAFYTFETMVARGRGIFRLTESKGGWKGWTLTTNIIEIKGHEESTGLRWPRGVAHGATRSQKNWTELREEHLAYRDHDPEVVILGGGQGSLALAAQLGQLGVDALIIERNDRIGDSWRKRYKSQVLHDPVFTNYLPCVPFPKPGRCSRRRTSWRTGSSLTSPL